MSLRGLRHSYRTRRGPLPVLECVDLDVPAGGYVSVGGPSGAGKSTLLALIGGLERPQEGTAVVDGVDLVRLNGDELAGYRRDVVGFVFQHFGLVDTLTAGENVELACALAGTDRPRRRVRATELLTAVGLADRRVHRPTALSGGERQRVAIARAMANRPRLLLADEPTGNLDEGSAMRVIELLESLHRDRGCTLVVVTHNRAVAARAPRHLHLRDGRLWPA